MRIFEYEGSMIKYVSRVWCKSSDYWDVFFGMNERVRESFARNDVKLSFQNVNVRILEK